jgi:D-glycero-D-manno-heptose 1,7-bisphosphate phosphatase
MKRLVFLDRDGTLNVDHGYVFREEDWQWAPQSQEALKQLVEAGFTLAVITNQSGIGYGFYTEQDMAKIHDFMVKELQQHGVPIASIVFCPHRRDEGCDCRKPATGMADQIQEAVGPIDYPQSWTIGDKLADLHFGKNVGTKTALLRSIYWTEGDVGDSRPDVMADSLYDAVQKIVR